jgi:hypothetical protein
MLLMGTMLGELRPLCPSPTLFRYPTLAMQFLLRSLERSMQSMNFDNLCAYKYVVVLEVARVHAYM